MFGHTEIRIPTGTGTMFAAPSLLWHYVTNHRYRPPDEVIEAVKKYDYGWAVQPRP